MTLIPMIINQLLIVGAMGHRAKRKPILVPPVITRWDIQFLSGYFVEDGHDYFINYIVEL